MVHGSWSAWDPWTTCSVSCGGGNQSRKRTCSSPQPMNGGRDCVGIAIEQRTCSVWKCPDCSRTCSSNGVLQNCTFCECVNMETTGSVADADTGHPLPGTEVYLTVQQWAPFTITDARGTFSLSNLCNEEMKVKLKKTGFYSDKEVYDLSSSATKTVTLRKTTKPRFLSGPRSVAHILGDSSPVTFKCQASASPNKITYDWFKDGDILDGYQKLSDGLLIINDVNKADAGRYQCRATSLEGKTFSSPATLFVQDGTSGCKQEVTSKLISLPDTCEVNGKVTVDVGRCESSQICVQTDHSKEQGCCEPVATSTVEVQCQNHSYPLIKVTSCGCGACSKNSTNVIIRGTVYLIQVEDGSITGRVPPEYEGGIAVNGVEDNSYSYDDKGKFSVQTAITSERIILEFLPGHNRNFDRHVVVIQIIPGVTEYTTEVEIFPVAEVHHINSDRRNSISLQFSAVSKLPPAAEVTFEPESFLTPDGDVFNGTATIGVTYIDPRVADSLVLAPVEFTYDDDEGVRRPLETFGVINVRASDANGSNLIVSKPVELSFDPEELGIGQKSDGAPDAMLWGVNEETGNWEELAPLKYKERSGRQRRQFRSPWLYTSTYLPPRVSYINIDRPLNDYFCHISVAVFEDDERSVSVEGIEVRVHTKGSNGIYRDYSRGYTKWNGISCVRVPCGNDHEAYAVGCKVLPDNKLPPGYNYQNIKENTGVQFSSNSASTIRSLLGPVHIASSGSCYDSQSKYSFSFKYTKKSQYQEMLTDNEIRAGIPERKLDRFTDNNLKTNTTCMIQVGVLTLYPNQTTVRATSRKRSKTGDFLDTYTSPVFPSNNNRRLNTACIEVKCSRDISGYLNAVTNFEVEVFHPNRTTVCKLRDFRLPGAALYSRLDLYGFSNAGLGRIENRNYAVTFNVTAGFLEIYGYLRRPSNQQTREARSYCSQTSTIESILDYPSVLFDCSNREFDTSYVFLSDWDYQEY